MEFRTVLKKGTEHLVNCEDDLFVRVHSNRNSPDYYIGAVFDGCSTGMKSHFASALYSKILRGVLDRISKRFDSNEYSLEELAKVVSKLFFHQLYEVVNLLGMQDLEVVSTFIIVIICEDKYYAIVSGDGCIMVDDKEIMIESNNNAPDYLAYHLFESFEDVYENNIKKFEGEFNVSLSVCSDGIYSFRTPDLSITSEEVKTKVINDFLLDTNLMGSEAMLSRKYNILTKQGFSNYDDLSIVRFIK